MLIFYELNLALMNVQVCMRQIPESRGRLRPAAGWPGPGCESAELAGQFPDWKAHHARAAAGQCPARLTRWEPRSCAACVSAAGARCQRRQRAGKTVWTMSWRSAPLPRLCCHSQPREAVAATAASVESSALRFMSDGVQSSMEALQRSPQPLLPESLRKRSISRLSRLVGRPVCCAARVSEGSGARRRCSASSARRARL